METLGSFDFLLIAQQTEHLDRSYLSWMVYSLGPVYSLLIPASGLAVFLGAFLVVVLSKRPAVIAAYFVFVPLPFMIGLFASLQGAISSFRILAGSATAPKPAELGTGLSVILLTAFLGLLVTFPGYFVTSIGLFLRTLTSASSSPPRD